MKSKLRVAVVGGGWAGLAAAVETSAAGAEVTVFEAAKQLGGRARRVEVNGYELDNGQHLLIGAYRETLRLMHKVGVNTEHQLQRVPLDLNYPAADFRLRLPRLPSPLHLAIGLLAARGCSVTEKMAAVRFMRFLQRRNYCLATDCSVAELLDRNLQQGNLRRFLWEPLCLAALNTAPENASARIFLNVLRDSLGGSSRDTDLLFPVVDLGRIFPDAAAVFIRANGGRIFFSSRVEEITAALEIRGEVFDRVIVAVAPQHAANLLQKPPKAATVSEVLAGYSYEPIGTVYAGYPKDVKLPAPMLGLEGVVPANLGQWVFDRGLLTGEQGVVGFVLSARGAWDDLANDTLVVLLHAELEAALGRKLPLPLWSQVIRERRATFSCRPNLPRLAPQTDHAGLWLAGDYVCADYPATLEGAMRSGVAAAHGALAVIPGSR